MPASGKHAQHARRVIGIGGLAENVAVDDNYSVGAEHEIVRTLTRHCERLLAGQPLSTCFRAFSGLWIFSDIRRLHFESDSGITQ